MDAFLDGAGADEFGTPNGHIDRTFRMEKAARLSVRAITKSRLSVTELKYDGTDFGLTEPVAQEDAFLVGLQLRPYPLHQLWIEGREVPVYGVRPGDTLFFDQKSVQAAQMADPFHCLMFYLPRAFLDELANDLEAPPIDQLHPRAAMPVADAFINRVGKAIRPALDLPFEANTLYASHLMLAFGTYICANYASLRAPRTSAGGLNGWQQRAALELIDAHIDGSMSIQEIAAVCGLSASHFGHAFRQSIGVAPHRWLLARRVDRAKALLMMTRHSLADIALACGFADQSHLTRVFRGAMGVSPGAWRTALRD